MIFGNRPGLWKPPFQLWWTFCHIFPISGTDDELLPMEEQKLFREDTQIFGPGKMGDMDPFPCPVFAGISDDVCSKLGEDDSILEASRYPIISWLRMVSGNFECQQWWFKKCGFQRQHGFLSCYTWFSPEIFIRVDSYQIMMTHLFICIYLYLYLSWPIFIYIYIHMNIYIEQECNWSIVIILHQHPLTSAMAPSPHIPRTPLASAPCTTVADCMLKRCPTWSMANGALSISVWVGWTSIHQLFWGSLGTRYQGVDIYIYIHIMYIYISTHIIYYIKIHRSFQPSYNLEYILIYALNGIL